MYLIKYDFKLFFNNDFSLYIATYYYHNTTMINLKICLLNRIEDFIEKRYIFSHIDEKNISTVVAKLHIIYDKYIVHPMQAIEVKLNMILAKTPHLVTSLKRAHIHPLIRKYSHIDLV